MKQAYIHNNTNLHKNKDVQDQSGCRTTNGIHTIKLLMVITLFLITLSGKSQYIPQYSQLIKTLEFINPGYNASKVDPSATLLYRNQWVGFNGAPKTYGININVPINKWHTGFGINTIAETYGLTTQTNIALNANVDVKVTNTSYLTFGLSGGVETKRIDMERAVYSGNDPFDAGEYNSNDFYTAIGLNYFAQDLHLGAGFHYTQLKGNNYSGNEYYSLYLNGSYLFNMSDDWAIKPSAVFRHYAQFNDLDLGAFVLYKDLVWGGVAYRVNQAFIFFADFKITRFVRLGYSYDFGVGGISKYNFGSHEVTVEFTLPGNARQFERTIN